MFFLGEKNYIVNYMFNYIVKLFKETPHLPCADEEFWEFEASEVHALGMTSDRG